MPGKGLDSYVDQLVNVTLFQIVQDRGIVQVGQVGHVFRLLVLGRVHLLQQIFFQGFLFGA